MLRNSAFTCAACLGLIALAAGLSRNPQLRADAPKRPGLVLPAPDRSGGKPLMQALSERKTSREFKAQDLSEQQLSDLLWAAFGVNRPEISHRTAPSAMNAQEIDLYVAMRNGVYLYEAGPHRLTRVLDGDVRAQTGGQEFAVVAPVTLIFVADFGRMVKAKPDQKEFYSTFDAGCISQNVYLFCASAGLGTVVHDLDRASLRQSLGLRPDQKIVLAQAVGCVK